MIQMHDVIWKDIPGVCQGYYKVSSDGRILSVRKNKEIKTSGRYKSFEACINGTSYFVRVHQAVASAFIGECPKGMQVAHLDGNKHNNNKDNLAYVTPKENISHKILHGTHQFGENASRSKLTGVIVSQIKQKINHHEFYDDIAKEFDVHRDTIQKIALEQRWTEIEPRIISRRSKGLTKDRPNATFKTIFGD